MFTKNNVRGNPRDVLSNSTQELKSHVDSLFVRSQHANQSTLIELQRQRQQAILDYEKNIEQQMCEAQKQVFDYFIGQINKTNALILHYGDTNQIDELLAFIQLHHNRESYIENGVQKSVVKNPAISIETFEQYGPALYAATNDHVHVLKHLKEKGISLTAIDKDGDTPLHQAAISGRTASFKYLLEQGVYLLQPNFSGQTPLSILKANNHVEGLTLVRDVVRSINRDQDEIYSQLNLNVGLTVVQHKLSILGDDIIAAQRKHYLLTQQQALQAAKLEAEKYIAKNSSHEIVNPLVKAHVETLLTQENKKEENELSWSEIQNNQQQEFAKCQALKQAVQIARHSKSNETETDNALLKILQEIQKEFSDMIEKALEGCQTGDLTYVQKVVEHIKLHQDNLINPTVTSDGFMFAASREVSYTNFSCSSPLHVAARHNQVKVLSYLFEKGMVLDSINADGDTPLHCALRNKAIEAADYLVEQGLSLTARNESGVMPIDYVDDLSPKSSGTIYTKLLSKIKTIQNELSELSDLEQAMQLLRSHSKTEEHSMFSIQLGYYLKSIEQQLTEDFQLAKLYMSEDFTDAQLSGEEISKQQILTAMNKRILNSSSDGYIPILSIRRHYAAFLKQKDIRFQQESFSLTQQVSHFQSAIQNSQKTLDEIEHYLDRDNIQRPILVEQQYQKFHNQRMARIEEQYQQQLSQSQDHFNDLQNMQTQQSEQRLQEIRNLRTTMLFDIHNSLGLENSSHQQSHGIGVSDQSLQQFERHFGRKYTPTNVEPEIVFIPPTEHHINVDKEDDEVLEVDTEYSSNQRTNSSDNYGFNDFSQTMRYSTTWTAEEYSEMYFNNSWESEDTSSINLQALQWDSASQVQNPFAKYLPNSALQYPYYGRESVTHKANPESSWVTNFLIPAAYGDDITAKVVHSDEPPSLLRIIKNTMATDVNKRIEAQLQMRQRFPRLAKWHDHSRRDLLRKDSKDPEYLSILKMLARSSRNITEGTLHTITHPKETIVDAVTFVCDVAGVASYYVFNSATEGSMKRNRARRQAIINFYEESDIMDKYEFVTTAGLGLLLGKITLDSQMIRRPVLPYYDKKLKLVSSGRGAELNLGNPSQVGKLAPINDVKFRRVDWSHVGRKGDTAAEHIQKHHGSMRLTKDNQGVFYSNPIKTVEKAWVIAQKNNVKPVTIGNRDVYVIPCQSAGYAGGAGGQLQNFNHVTIITHAGKNKVITAYPSGSTPPLPKDYKFILGESYDPKPPRF